MGMVVTVGVEEVGMEGSGCSNSRGGGDGGGRRGGEGGVGPDGLRFFPRAALLCS